MTVEELVSHLYHETPVEIEIDFEAVFEGTAEEAAGCAYRMRPVKEAYISVDGAKLVIALGIKKRKPRK